MPMSTIVFRPAATAVSTPNVGHWAAETNGGIVALHFKLAVANDSDGKGSSYEDTEFQYTPRLDSNRDRDLLELLPDYLSEEITFSRMNAAKFYGRVAETLTKRRMEEE